MKNTERRVELPRTVAVGAFGGVLLAMILLAIAVIKETGTQSRQTAENHALRTELEAVTANVDDLRRQSDVKSQQLRDAGIAESPLAAPAPPSAATTTTTSVRRSPAATRSPASTTTSSSTTSSTTSTTTTTTTTSPRSPVCTLPAVPTTRPIC